MHIICHGNIDVSGNLTLTTIPRASSITATDANIESATTININRASSSFTHTITYSFSNLTGTIATKTTETSLGWIIPSSFYSKIPNSKTGIVTLTCTTYSGNTSIGNKTTTFTISVPTSGINDCRPIIDTASVVDSNLSTTLLTGDEKRLVRYKSWIVPTITGRCLNYSGFSSLKEGISIDLTNDTTATTSGATTSILCENIVIYSDVWRTTF